MGMGLVMANLKAIPGGGGMAVVANAVEPYPFTPEFERAVVAWCVSSRDFYSRIGAHLDPKALKASDAINLLKACKAIAEQTGEGPSTSTAAIQRLRAWREDGKLAYEQVMSAVEYLDAAEDAGLPDLEEVVNEVAQILKKIGKRDVTRKALETAAKNGDFSKVAEAAAALERIGKSKQTQGESLHADIFDEILAENAKKRLPTGCSELDTICGGGLPVGYTLFLGREKSGKSMALSSIASEAVWQGKNVLIATLELASLKQIERVLANILNLPMDTIQTDGALAKARLTEIQPQLGKLISAKFSPDTPVSEITGWVDQVRKTIGRVDLLVVDYADLVGVNRVSKDANEYRDAKVVGNAFRDHALMHGYVTISATQGKRGSGINKPLDIDDVADSQHKVRVADMVIAMRMDPESKDLVDWYLILNRDGTDRVGTNPLPTDRERGRMFPVARMEPW